MLQTEISGKFVKIYFSCSSHLILFIFHHFRQRRSQDFSKGEEVGGGGGRTVSNIIVMAFYPRNIVGCLLKKGLQRGVSRAFQDPLATPLTAIRIGSIYLRIHSLDTVCTGQPAK